LLEPIPNIPAASPSPAGYMYMTQDGALVFACTTDQSTVAGRLGGSRRYQYYTAKRKKVLQIYIAWGGTCISSSVQERKAGLHQGMSKAVKGIVPV
jgi:hypothetical protein